MTMDKMLSPKELAVVLGISLETLYVWTAQRRIPHIKIGRLVRFKLDEVKKWLDAKRVEPNSC